MIITFLTPGIFSGFVLLLLGITSNSRVEAQGCANTCPPLNYGEVVKSLCEGDVIDHENIAGSVANVEKIYSVCHPKNIESIPSSFALKDFRGEGKITVIANYYSGCNAGRRESGVFAHVAQRFYNLYGNERLTFIQSLKGGGSCQGWADIYQADAEDLYPGSGVVPREMPLSVDDFNYEIRDDLFTAPFGHPSYVILDENLKIRHKFIGPCCGYEDYWGCTADIAKSLDSQLTEFISSLLEESAVVNSLAPTASPVTFATSTPTALPTREKDCDVGIFSDWSECSVKCGGSNTYSAKGIQFRWRKVNSKTSSCPSPVEIKECAPIERLCADDESSCVTEFGDKSSYTVETIVTDLASPRDVDFHPTPGLHLKDFSEGRTFHSEIGEEAWIVNGGNHSVSIVAALGTDYQTTLSRRDRGYYHYMTNGTALSFNKVFDSGRSSDRDGFNYWAICNDNTNTYLGTKEANFFMGPTLYNSDPINRNTVNRLGENCREEEPCYFLHSDMLHEAPACIGITHDPELITSYGNVYWAFDATGNRQHGQLVRFDFQQPHGPGSMDHSVAAIRRYVEVKLERGPPGVHAGMVVHPKRREVYIAVPGADKIIVVDADSGSFARTAREEYPIFSNRLPSFEYSIWECSDQRIFAEGIRMPTGLALSNSGDTLFVAERETGKIIAFEVASGTVLHTIDTEFKTIGGMAISPVSNMLFFVDEETNTLNKIHRSTLCTSPATSRLNDIFASFLEKAEEELGEKLLLHRDYNCKVDPVIPDAAFFDQVHTDTGYADENEDVQSTMAGMDASAALLANRTDCGFESDLNFDSLLLGGYYCHICLPEIELTCDFGGSCSNVQWLGYTCDNEFFVSISDELLIELSMADGTIVDPSTMLLQRSVTYRFNVLDNESKLALCTSLLDVGQPVPRRLTGYGSSATEDDQRSLLCASRGPLLISVNDQFPSEVVLLYVQGHEDARLELSVEERNTKRNLSVGAIIGIVTAVVVTMMIVLVLCKKSRQKHTTLEESSPFTE